MNIQLRKLHLLIQHFMILQLRHTSFITQSLKEIHSGSETGLIDTGPFPRLCQIHVPSISKFKRICIRWWGNFWHFSIPTILVQVEWSFQHLSVQYEFDFWNENVIRAKRGNFKKPRLTNCAKMQIWKWGVPVFKLASCMYCWTFCQYLHRQGYRTRLAISWCKKSICIILHCKEH